MSEESQVLTAGDLGTFRGGSGFPVRYQGKKSGDLPFFKVSDMNSGGNELFMTRANNYISEARRKALRAVRMPKGAIVFAKVGAAVFQERKRILAQDSCVDNNMAAFIVDEDKLDVRFAHYLLTAFKMSDLVAVGALPSLNGGQLRSIPLLVPNDLAEQRRITAALTDADDLIATLERLIAKKQAIKQGVMQQLLTGRTRLPGFTEPWTELTLGEVTRIKTGSRNNQDKKTGGKYPFFVRSATIERIDSYSYDCEAILVPGEGNIGSIFHYVNGKFEVHQRVYKISDFAPGTNGRFIYHYMRQYFGSHAMENSVKATVDSLRLPTFKNFQLRLPPSEEQAAIVRSLDDAAATVALLEKRLAKAHAIKTGMTQQLLTGRTRLPVEVES